MKKIIIPFVILLLYLPCMAQDDSDAMVAPESQGIDSVKTNRPLIYPGFGVALLRNEIAPVFHINIGFNHRNRYEANLNTCSYFLFEKGTDNKYNIHRNTYANAEFLLNFSPLSKSLKNYNGIGVGYLIESRGQFFGEPSVVIYYKRRYRFFSVMPGIILDDNFKDVWPVISIRL